ncbi:MAG: iron-sulfur cluster assembly accessory protein [Phycisphaerae bacterium]|nr:iron-sulfur cluster assembly accessory protein [Phycisphaerae bacterium]
MSVNPDADTNATNTPPARQRAVTASEGQGVRLTELAAKNARDYIQKMENPETTYLYFGVKGGGCSGLSYVLDLRDERSVPIAEMDEVFESQGVVIVCDFKSYEVGNLGGTTIDFEEGLVGKGFTFHNPNAKRSCGCGASYSA